MPPPSLPQPSGRIPAVAGPKNQPPGSIEYAPADAVGFEHLPAAVLDALSGVLLGPVVAADAEEPVIRRRADGIHYQHATGWWAGENRYVTIDARRLLAFTDGRKLKPVSGWKIEGAVSHFQPGVRPTTSEWRFEAGGGGSAPPAENRVADDVLEALPGPLAAPVLGAEASAWRKMGRGWATETIVATKASPERVLVLKAERRAPSEARLAAADWQAVTLDAPIVWIQSVSTDGYGRVALGAARQPHALPP